MKRMCKPLSVLLAVIMTLGMLTVIPPAVFGAADIEAAETGAAETITAVDDSNGVIDSEGEYILTGTASNYSLVISADCTLTLRGLTVTNTENGGNYGIFIQSGTTNLVISGENSITTGGIYGGAVAIGVSGDATLIISGENDADSGNVLNVTEKWDGKAAIGGAWDQWICGNIVINSGTINAIGGGNGASVIGKGGNCDSDNSVTVNGGVITAELKNEENNSVFFGGGSMTAEFNGGTVTQIIGDSSKTYRYGTVTVNYLDENGEEQTDEAICLNEGFSSLDDNRYFLYTDLTISDRITVSGDVELILGDGATLTAPNGIDVTGNENSLAIFCQSEGTGALTIELTGAGEQYYAALGSRGESFSDSRITINGGVITVSTDSLKGAAIGGGYSDGASIEINGGTVSATVNNEQSTSQGAAIGAGARAATGVGAAAEILINGGSVTASILSDGDGAAIGGSDRAWPSYVQIENGTVIANGGKNGAGIGSGGQSRARAYITINGGSVTASGEDGAAIGSGNGSYACSITINDGIVSAVSSGSGAAIGAGEGSSGEVEICGGTVTASCTGSGCGIGGLGETVSDIFLNWTHMTDSITSDSYSGSVRLDKPFSDGTSLLRTGSVSDNSVLANKTLTPPAPNTITFINEDGEETTQDDVIELTEDYITLTDGLYAVTDDLTFSTRIYITGDVHLILCDGATLTAPMGIDVSGTDNSLSIYCQSGGDGALTIDYDVVVGSTMDSGAALGGSGDITINGGVITVTTNSGKNAAIGGNIGDSHVVINGGTVNASVSNDRYDAKGAAIGGGYMGNSIVEINGGTVNASCSGSGCGIGGGLDAYESHSLVFLNWTHDDDSVTADSYLGDVKILKPFSDATSVIPVGDISDNSILANKTLVPYYCAKVGDTKYSSFEEAVTAANGAKITLLADIADAYTMAAGQAIKVVKNGYTVTMNAPDGGYVVKETETPAQDETPAFSTYTVVSAAASVGDEYYETFPEAVTAANGAKITLLADIPDAYTMASDQFIRVVKNGYTITISAPVNYQLVKEIVTPAQDGEPEFSTYSIVQAVAAVDGVYYETFAEAVTAADGETITLYADIDNEYTMSVDQTIRIRRNGHTFTLNPPEGNYLVKETVGPDMIGLPMFFIYTVVPAVASVGNDLYETFGKAAAAADGAVITLLADITDAYTLAADRTIRVIKDGHTLTVNPPEGSYVIKAVDSSETTGEGESAVTVTTTTYTVIGAVASVGGDYYETFAEAVTAANGAKITLLTNITDAYTMSADQTIKVIKDGHTLTVNPPEGNYILNETETPAQDDDPAFSTYTVTPAVAEIGNTLYATFTDAASAADDAIITLLADIDDTYTLPADKTLKVNKNDHSLTVAAPDGAYVLRKNQVEAQGDDPAYTEYSVRSAEASVGGVNYETFEAAVNAANGETVTLLANIADEYILSGGKTIRVIKNGYDLTVGVPSNDYQLGESTSGNVTTYTCTRYCAEVNGTKYASFSDAANASAGTNTVELLCSIESSFNLNNYSYDILKVRKGNYSVSITNYDHTTENKGVTTYYKDSSGVYVDGIAAEVTAGLIYIGAVTGMVIYLDNTGTTAVEGIVLEEGAEVTFESASGEILGYGFEIRPRNPGSQCIQEITSEDEPGLGERRKFKNIKLENIILDFNVEITELLMEHVKGFADANIPKGITNLVDYIIPDSYDKTKLTIKWPLGFPFYAPDLTGKWNTGHVFKYWYENDKNREVNVVVATPGDPTLTALWADSEAKVGDKEYEFFSEAADAATAAGNATITLLMNIDSPYTMAVGQTMHVNKNHYTVPVAPPEGYDLHTVTDASGITTYTLSHKYTVTLDYRFNDQIDTVYVWQGGTCQRPDDPDRPGWYIDYWYYVDTTKPEGQQNIQYDFTATVTGNINLFAQWAQMPTYDITVAECARGTVEVMQSTYEGDTVTVTVTPNDGCELTTLTYTPEDGEAAEITAVEGVYSFVMPASNVTVTAIFTGSYFAGHTLSLKGAIGVNFYLDITAEEAQNAVVGFEWMKGGKKQTATFDMSAAEHKDQGYVATCFVSASDMTADITATLKINSEEVDTDVYTVKAYADYILSHTDIPEYAEAAPLVKAMLNYGTAAQEFFGRNTDKPANASLSDDDKVIADVTAADINKPYNEELTSLPEGVTFANVSLSLKSETTLSLYFTSEQTLTFACNKDGQKYKDVDTETVTVKGVEYQVARIRGISARELGFNFTLTVTVGSTDYSVVYSPMNYCYNVLNDNNQPAALQNVCKALYLYAEAADDYFD